MTAAVLLALWLIALPNGTDPMLGLPLAPVGEATLSGKTLFVIREGDFYSPAFSPDGRRLAYARDVVVGDTELTEVFVRDLATGKETKLLDAEASRKYAAYASFVTQIEWKESDRLVASIHDGDVGETEVLFDAASGRILSEEHFEGAVGPPPDDLTLSRLAATVPDWRREVVETALINGFQVDRGYVVQKNYHGEDHHIWYLDVESKEATRLLELPDDWLYALGGGVSFDSWILFLLHHEGKAYLLWYQEGRVALAREFEATAGQFYTSLEVKHRSPERIFLAARLHGASARRHNPLLLVDRSGLKIVKNTGELYDVVFDSAGRLVCLVVWENGERHLVVQELGQQ